MSNATITIEFNILKQINVQDNDILIVDVDNQEDLEMIGRLMAKIHEGKNIMLVAADGIPDIELVTEEMMNKYGWQRIDGFAKRNK